MKSLPLALLSLSLIFTSCKKDETGDEEFSTAQDQNQVQSETDQAYRMAAEAVDSAEAGSATIPSAPCATLSIDTVNTVVTIDFGTGCTGVDGRTRAGEIIVDYSGTFPDPGSTFEISFNSYTVEGNTLSGSLAITAVSRNNAGNLEFTYVATNAVLTFTDASSVSYSGTRTVEWTQGEGTQDATDDVFSVTGSGSGSSRSGTAYTNQITSAVILKTSCWSQDIFYPVSGVMELTPAGSATREINYGAGDCDKTIDITVGRRTYTVELP